MAGGVLEHGDLARLSEHVAYAVEDDEDEAEGAFDSCRGHVAQDDGDSLLVNLVRNWSLIG